MRNDAREPFIWEALTLIAVGAGFIGISYLLKRLDKADE